MSELAPLPNPDVYKNHAQRRVDAGDQLDIRSTLGELTVLRDEKVKENFEYDSLTRDNEAIAHDAALSLKPDINATADAGQRFEAARKGQSQEDMASLNLLQRGAELDLARNTKHAVEAARMLGHLANR